MDKLTTTIAQELIARFDAAVSAGSFDEMQKVVEIVTSSPNQAFKAEVLRQIGNNGMRA